MRVRALGVLLLTACAAPNQLLTPDEAGALGTRTWEGATDEVFDATWLTLTSLGLTTTQSDRVAGTLVVTRAGHTFDVDVAALGSEQRVKLTPRQASTRAESRELLDGLEAGTRSLLRAWRDVPEWKFDGRRNLLTVPGFAFAPPLEWQWLDFDISRRVVVVQQRRARTGVNPTLLVEIDRRRPDSRLQASLRHAAGLALVARKPRLDEVVWHAHQAVLGASDVRLVMVCPLAAKETCADLWAQIEQSIIK